MFPLVQTEKGQSLVEYALILVLVAVVAIAILLKVGPVVGGVFSTVVEHLGLSNSVITDVTATRTGNGSGNDVTVKISVSTNTKVTVSDSQNAPTVQDTPCNGSCTFTLNGVGFNEGTVTVTAAAGGTRTDDYAAKN
jgi:Flp pilus assembly pilin Flp